MVIASVERSRARKRSTGLICALSSSMAMAYTVWYSRTLRSLPMRQGAPFRAPRLIQYRQQSANILQQANRKRLTIAEDRRRRQSLHAAQMRTLEMIINDESL